MTDKKIYFGLGAAALAALLVTAALVYKAGRLSQTDFSAKEPIATSSAVLGEEASPSAVSATLILNFGEERGGERKIATYSAVRSPAGTALDLLLQAAKEQSFAVDYEEQSFGAFIKSIDGVSNQKSVFWLYYVNGRPAPVAADKQKIRDGDGVEFRFTNAL